MIRKNKKYVFIGIILLILISILILVLINKSTKEKEVIKYEKEEVLLEIDEISSWIVYWDLDVDSEIKELDNKLNSISYFAANFNENNQLFVSEELIDYYVSTKKCQFNKYITIVNDVIYNDGGSSLKDKSVLKNLLEDEVTRKKHVNEIIDLAKKYEFDGIELDYEQIKGDMQLWNEYLLFINELYIEANLNGLSLRILLEPNTPIDELNFIEGPTYIMMCYNLYGSFSEPGEKTNKSFIEDLIKKMNKINGSKEFAIATGGFDWDENNKVMSVTEIEVNKILKENKIEIKRDFNSQYLYFNYLDKNNTKHEVWYADKITLKYLYETIIGYGYKVNLWRLGGNQFN